MMIMSDGIGQGIRTKQPQRTWWGCTSRQPQRLGWAERTTVASLLGRQGGPTNQPQRTWQETYGLGRLKNRTNGPGSGTSVHAVAQKTAANVSGIRGTPLGALNRAP